jgi:hypothetical protein
MPTVQAFSFSISRKSAARRGDTGAGGRAASAGAA